jgi:hypothetical protein
MIKICKLHTFSEIVTIFLEPYVKGTALNEPLKYSAQHLIWEEREEGGEGDPVKTNLVKNTLSE